MAARGARVASGGVGFVNAGLALAAKLDGLQEIPMTVYVIADIKVTDDGWIPGYAASVHDIVHKHGGKYLSRSGNVKTLEGKPLDTTFIALLEFPSVEAVQAFATDPNYAPYAKARQAGSESRLQLIDDTDVAGTISLSAQRMIRQNSRSRSLDFRTIQVYSKDWAIPSMVG